LSHSEAACPTVDAPGACGDGVRHHLRDDDADNAEFAVLFALRVKSDPCCLCRGRLGMDTVEKLGSASNKLKYRQQYGYDQKNQDIYYKWYAQGELIFQEISE
jgi:hypothetical protein